MNTITWDCRGLGSPSAVQELTRLVSKHTSNVLLLIDTWKRREMEWLRVRLKFEGCLAVDYVGRGCGLALLWTSDIKLEIQYHSNSHIDAHLFDHIASLHWRFTGFYGNSVTSQWV